MSQISKEEFGQFLKKLRKEKGLTQKELAEKLYISDKAISKWERGLSMPDISLLMPLGEILGVTATELLSGRRIEENVGLTVAEVEDLMRRTIDLSQEEIGEQNKNKQKRKKVFYICTLIVIVELVMLYSIGYTLDAMYNNLFVVEGLMLIFGAYFTFFIKETLPRYYDQNQINYYNDGFLKIRIPSVYFNNSNWKHIIHATHTVIMVVWILFPLVYLVGSSFTPVVWGRGKLIISLVTVFSMFIPIYVAGRKYE